MNNGKSAKAPVRDWLDRSAKLSNSQKAKPIATVHPIQSNGSNTKRQPECQPSSQNLHAMFNQRTVTVQYQRSSHPNINKANHQPPQSNAGPAAPAHNPRESNNHRAHVPAGSGVKGNVVSNNAVQININVRKNHYQSNPPNKPAVNAPRPANVARKTHVPPGGGVHGNVASGNSVQLNVNVCSNVKSTRPRSNDAHYAPKPNLQSAACTTHVPAGQNKSTPGHKRNANKNNNHGIQSTRIKRIIGGNIIDIEAAPYMLSMRLNDEHICGAAIIGKEWGLTAAHCCIKLAKNRAGRLYVYSGSSSLRGAGKSHRITWMLRHEKYVAGIDDDYDICTVRVHPPFEYSERTAAVKLPEPSVPFDNSRGAVSGWGYTEADGTTVSPVLKSIGVRKVDLERCKYMYRNMYTIHDRDVCYKSENVSGDACEGDSGGPLVNDDFILLGIVSFGDECGYSTLPGVYTDTLQFRNWIKNKTDI